MEGDLFENCEFTGTEFTNYYFHDNIFDNCRFSATVKFHDKSQKLKPIKASFSLPDTSLRELKGTAIHNDTLEALAALKNRRFADKQRLFAGLEKLIGKRETALYGDLISEHLDEAWQGACFDKKNYVNLYLAIRDSYNEGGAHDKEGNYYYKSRHAETRYNTKNLLKKIGHFFFGEVLIGYGERPFNSLIASLLVISLFAFFYMGCGLVFSLPDETNTFNDEIISGSIKNIGQYWRFFYFSVVTFTTVGYGDIRPINAIGKCLSATEMLLGVTLMGAWVATLFKKLAR